MKGTGCLRPIQWLDNFVHLTKQNQLNNIPNLIINDHHIIAANTNIPTFYPVFLSGYRVWNWWYIPLGKVSEKDMQMCMIHEFRFHGLYLPPFLLFFCCVVLVFSFPFFFVSKIWLAPNAQRHNCTKPMSEQKIFTIQIQADVSQTHFEGGLAGDDGYRDAQWQWPKHKPKNIL